MTYRLKRWLKHISNQDMDVFNKKEDVEFYSNASEIYHRYLSKSLTKEDKEKIKLWESVI